MSRILREPFSAEFLREWLEYNPETGVFTWLKDRGRRGKTGDIAGTASNGYQLIGLGGLQYRTHRLAFLYMTGEWPSCFVDHVNGDRADNRWCNLRAATYSINAQNERGPRSNNTSGFLGVSFHEKTKKWRAVVTTGGRASRVNHSLGLFDTKEDAHSAYINAKRRLHEGCTI